jgi:short-subunit dehydrogenase
VKVIVAPIDLTEADAVDRVKRVTDDLEVGCFVMNAGSDDHGTRFLDTPVDEWTALARRNVFVPIELCHHFGRAMRDRGRGALVIVSSGAGWAGGGRMAIYSSTKAFDRTFAEALWAELRPAGVDVLTLVLATTDTPALRRLLERTGMPAPALADPVEAVRLGLAHLTDGPALVFGEGGVVDTATAATRRQFAEMMTAGTDMFFGP